MEDERQIIPGFWSDLLTNRNDFPNARLKTQPGNGAGDLSVQNPLTCDGDSVYKKDIWPEESITTNWLDIDGTGEDIACIPFNSLHTRIRNSTTDNPKILLIHFNRTIASHNIGFGASGGGDFSNIKIILVGSGGVERSLIDDSANNTKYTSRDVQFGPEIYNAVRIEFHTSDPVTISNITIQKSSNVQAQISAIDPDGELIPVGATNSGNLKITDAENGLSIAQGLVQGTSFIHKFGSADNFSPVDLEVAVWDGADSTSISRMTYIYSVTDDIDTVSSESALDTQLIEIQGLDINYNLVTQNVTLNGQSKVLLITPLLRVFRIKNIGSINLAGNVYCYVDGLITLGIPDDLLTIRAMVHFENNQTEMAIFTIPAGFTGYMRDWYATTSGAKRDSQHTIKIKARKFGQVFQLKHKANISVSGTSYIQHRYEEPEVFSEKTDVEVSADTDQVDAGVSAGFDIVLKLIGV